MEFSHTVDLVAGLHGRFYILKNDTFIGRSMSAYGEWTEGEFELFKTVFRPGDVAIDVGANIGSMTVPLARAVGPSGTVYAFEPQPGLFRLLAANTLLNGVLNTRLFQAACGSAQASIMVAELPFDVAENYGALSLDVLAQATGPFPRRRVPLVPLDDVIDAGAVRLIKVDVEGMEAQVIDGAAAIIRQHRPLLYVENELPVSSRATIEAIQRLDYRLYWHVSPQFNPNNFKCNRINIFGQNVCINMFCVPAESDFSVTGLRQVVSPTEHPRLP